MKSQWNRLKHSSIKTKTYLAIACIICVALFIHFRWLFIFDIFTSGDWVYIPDSKYSDFAEFKPIWINSNLGVVSSVPQFYVIRFLEGLLYSIFSFNFAVNEKIFFLFPIIILPIIGIFILSRRYASIQASSIAALFYAYSTPYLMFQAGGVTIAVGFALAPILIDRFLVALETKSKGVFHTLIFSLILSASIIYELRVTLITLTICILLLLRHLIIQWHSTPKLEIFLRAILVAVSTLALQAFWLFPLLLSRGANSSVVELAERGIFYSHITFLNAISLYHPYWTGSRPIAFINNPINALFYIIPILSLIPLLYSIKSSAKKRVWIFTWVLITIIGILLTKQTNEPIDWLYEWLFNNIPGFSLYRESSKFYLYSIIGFTGLIALSYDILKQYISNHFKKSVHILSFLLVVLFLLVPAINASAIFTGSFRTLLINRERPKDYQTIETYLTENSQEVYRTLWVPRDSRWTPYSDAFPRVSLIDILERDIKQFLPQNITLTQYEKLQFFLQNQSIFDTILKHSAIKYVFIPIQDFDNEDDFFIHYGGRVDDNIRQRYIQLLDNNTSLSRVDIGLNEVIMYEFTDFNPYISLTPTITSVNSYTNINDTLTFNKNTFSNNTSFLIEDNLSKIQSDIEIQSLYSDLTELSFIENSLIESIDINKKNALIHYNSEDKNIIAFNKNQEVNISPQNTPSNIKGNTKNSFIAQPITTKGEASFIYNPFDAVISNDIPNPSFDEGLWQETVGNCNRYDDDDQVAMNLSLDSNTGPFALELLTRRHTACTSPGVIPIEGGEDYYFGFKFKSENANKVGFYIGFQNSEGDEIRKFIPNEKKGEWQLYEQKFTAPEDSNNISFFLYNFELDGIEIASTVFDDITLIKLPELDNKYYVTQTANYETPTIQNETIKLNDYDTTYKNISLSNIKQTANVLLAESYHPQWKVILKDGKYLNGDNHFIHTGFLNGWSIPIRELCVNEKLACTQNEDGTYNTELKISFITQDYFERGLLVSSISGVVIIITTILSYVLFRNKYPY